MPRSPPSSQQTPVPPGGLSSSSTTGTSTGVTDLPAATSEPVTAVSTGLHDDKTKGPGADEVEDEEEEEDDEKILEIGHNGRWQKINHQVHVHVHV